MGRSSSEEPFNILISSAGRRVALLRSFQEALASLSIAGQVLAADASPLSSAFHLADRSFAVPRCLTPEFIPRMLEICREQRIRLLIPTIDTELPVLAAHRESFAGVGTTVPISAPETIAISNDKRSTHRWLTGNGFPTVRQGEPAEVLGSRRDWPLPLVVKPAAGSASLGLGIARTEEELQSLLRTENVVVQEFAPGDEFTVCAYIERGGRCTCTVPRQRLEVRAGEVSKGVTVRAPVIEDLVRRIAEALPGAFGVINAQLIRDRADGSLRVIEINARFGGGYPLTWSAGARFSRWLIEDQLELPRSPDRAASWRPGVVMLRFDDAVFVEAAAAGLAP